MSTLVKICGLTDEDGIAAAIENGADMLGFVFFPNSPRHIAPEEAADLLSDLPVEVRDQVRVVGLFVDPTDAELDAVFQHLRLDMVQLHGAETPDRVEAIRQEFGVEAMKAIGVAGPEDLKTAERYVGVADMLLFDAKPPAGADRPGGNATAFPWQVMAGWTGTTPWLLAGGLTPDNVAEAIRVAGAPGVDVSSGVENAPGDKDPAKIAAFLKAVECAET